MSVEIVLAAPVRTPIGRFGGALAPLSAADLGTAAAAACLARADCPPSRVDQVIFGHARQAGGGPNSARQIAFRAGVPVDRPAYAVNQACGSGLQAVLSAARTIAQGEARVVLAGGTESMSNTPYLLPRARWGYRLGHAELVDGMYRDGFNDPLSELVMGETAEELAAEAGIDRAAADRYAAESQQRCQRAREAGRFAAEIAPVEVPAAKPGAPPAVVAADEHPRDGVTVESLAQAAGGLPRGRDGDRRQRLGDHRRRGGPAGRLGGRRRGAGAAGGGAAGRLGGGRGRAADHGHRPGAGGAPAARPHRPAPPPTSARWSSTRPSPRRCSPA